MRGGDRPAPMAGNVLAHVATEYLVERRRLFGGVVHRVGYLEAAVED